MAKKIGLCLLVWVRFDSRSPLCPYWLMDVFCQFIRRMRLQVVLVNLWVSISIKGTKNTLTRVKLRLNIFTIWALIHLKGGDLMTSPSAWSLGSTEVWCQLRVLMVLLIPQPKERSTWIFFFNWSIAALQCCVRFWCPAKWFGYASVYIFFFMFSSFIVYYRALKLVPCALQYGIAVYLFYR